MPPNNVPLGGDNLSSQIFPQRPTQAPPTAPTAPASQVPPTSFNTQPKKGGMGKILVVIVVILVIAAGAGAAYYYTDIGKSTSLFSKAPYTEDALASQIFNGVTKIDKSSYSLNVKIASEPLEADAEPFNVAVPVDEKRLEAYKRDYDRVRDIQKILNLLLAYFYSNQRNKYPTSLSSLPEIGTLAQNQAYSYTAKSDLSDFTLKVTLESAEAVDYIKSMNRYGKESLSITDKTITFNSKSPSYLYLSAEPPQPAIVNVLNMKNYISYIPANFKFDGTLSGASEELSDKSINAKVGIMAITEFNDISVGVDAEFRKVEEDFYVIMRKFPSFFVDVSKLKDKWIKITQEDLLARGGSYFDLSSLSSPEGVKKQKDQAVEQFKLMLSVADRNKALVSENSPKKEDVDGITAYRYDLSLNKDTLPQFYKDLTTEFATKYPEKPIMKFDQSTLSYLESPQFNQVFDYLKKNTAFSLWVNGEGMPVKAQYTMRLVPDKNAKNSDHQIKLIVTLNLIDINQSVNIDVPADSITFEDAMILMTGQSKELYRMNQQISLVSTIRYALQQFNSEKKYYPSKLEELTTTNSEYAKRPYLKTIPVDIYTKQPFLYVNKTNDFALVYNIQLPPYKKGDSVRAIIDRNYVIGGKSNTTLKAVGGANTANAARMSEEGYTRSLKDSDGDGLADVVEEYIGTSVSKKDTDGDGSSDSEEVNRDSNPLGTGSLKSSNMYGY